MIRALSSFASDRRGIAAIEFAFIAPIIVALLVFGGDGWLRGTQISATRTAIQTGSRYYQAGGNDDPTAQTLSTAAWSTRPANGVIAVARSCTCGSTPTSCTTLCAGSNPPSAFVTLTATATYPGLIQSHAIAQSDIIRVR